MTIRDIAEKAGVSASTVSRVLSGSARISKETTERVKAIMDQMNYHPNQIARSLVSKTSNIIAVVLPMAPEKALSEPFLFDVLRGIGSEAGSKGYHILLSTGCDLSEETNAILDLAQNGIACGMLLLTSKVEDLLAEALLRQHFPFVVLGHPERDTQINWVDNDNFSAGRAATAHLISRGCRRIAFIGASSEHRMIVDRLKGWRAALSDASLLVVESLVLPVEYAEEGLDYRAALSLFVRPDRPDGVVAASDMQALASMNIARELGLRVPQDVSFISFNNSIAGLMSKPSLTTVDLDPVALGRHAFSLLYEAIGQEHGIARRTLVPYTLIERESVK